MTTRHGISRALRSVAALAACVALPLVAFASPAAAVVPTTPTFTSTIEPYPAWVTEKGCLDGVRPGVLALRDKVIAPTYGAATFYTQRYCNSTKESGHDNGTALDWMMNVKVPEQDAKARAFLGWLLASDRYGNTHAMGRRLGVMYVIYNNKVFKFYRASYGWTDYTTYVNGVRKPCSTLTAASYDTICHRDHVHLSLTPDGAAMRTSYWKTPVVTPETRKLAITTPTSPFATTRGSTVTLRGTTVNAGQSVQVYVRPTGKSWVAILSPVTSSSTGTWSASYSTSTTHEVQVRVSTASSNTVAVVVS